MLAKSRTSPRPSSTSMRKDSTMKLKQVKITICEACLNGEGEMCNVPGCALCRHAVDLPIAPEMYEVLQEWDYEEVLP